MLHPRSVVVQIIVLTLSKKSDMENSQAKKQLRRSLLQQRQSLTQGDWQSKSWQICQHLLANPLWQEAKTVLGYLSFRQEPDLSSLWTPDAIGSTNKVWGLPRCVDQDLTWHYWQPGDALFPNRYGIWEPAGDSPIIPAEQADLLLIPAVGADWDGYRLGYGGGYYDRLLARPTWQRVRKIAVLFEFALCAKLPVESYDRPLNYLLTEKGLHRAADP